MTEIPGHVFVDPWFCSLNNFYNLIWFFADLDQFSQLCEFQINSWQITDVSCLGSVYDLDLSCCKQITDVSMLFLTKKIRQFLLFVFIYQHWLYWQRMNLAWVVDSEPNHTCQINFAFFLSMCFFEICFWNKGIVVWKIGWKQTNQSSGCKIKLMVLILFWSIQTWLSCSQQKRVWKNKKEVVSFAEIHSVDLFVESLFFFNSWP